MRVSKKITIGIIAYNEEKNIRALIDSVLRQKQKDFIIQKILVISDGSTDNTVNEVRRIRNKKISLIIKTRRKGKSNRMNALFALCNTEILVQLDADIKLSDKNVFFQLIKPFRTKYPYDLVCGNHSVLIEENYINKAASFGVKVWEEAIDLTKNKGIFYRCTGHIRAFSKRFYKSLKYPDNLMLSEDLYSFYYAMTNNFRVTFTPKAYVYYKLASNPVDYIIQLSRFINTRTQREKYFDRKLISKYDTLNKQILLRAFIKNILSTNLLISGGFILLHTLTRFYEKFLYKPKSNWSIAYSTK